VTDLAQGYALCQRYARDSQSNFHYCFYLLPRAKRLAMCALYAFLRRADDIGDETAGGSADNGRPAASSQFEGRHVRLEALRASLDRAIAGTYDDPSIAALADTVNRYRIPPSYLHAAIDGVVMDLRGETFESFADLAVYCHRVASVVGQACIHIWGFQGEEAIKLAAQCGIAFQLTNILRDLGEDAARGRLYLPHEDLWRFSYTVNDLRRGVVDERFAALVRFEVSRAEEYYRAASGLEQYLHADGCRIYYAMFHTYYRLLKKIARLDGRALGSRVRLDGWEKLHTAAGAIVRPLVRRYTLVDGGVASL
jgi:15-cis-phytoene synthase